MKLIPVMVLIVLVSFILSANAQGRATPSKAIRVSEDGQRRRLLTNIPGSYPLASSLSPGRSLSPELKDVTLKLPITVGRDGHVENIGPKPCGNDAVCESLLPAAREIILKWIYTPSIFNGNAVRIATTVTLKFASE